MRFHIFVFFMFSMGIVLAYPYQTVSDQLLYNNPTYQIGSGVVPSSSSSQLYNYQNPSDPYYQPFKLWNTDPNYQIGSGVLASSYSSNTQNPYNPYYPYYQYNWDTFNTNYYNPYNNS